MELIQILMDFGNVGRVEKSAEFEYNSKRMMVCVSVNPWNEDVLFSLFLDREKIIENRVCLVGERLLWDFGDHEYSKTINGDFMFIPESPNYKTGNKVKYRDLGSLVGIYFIDKGDSIEN